MQENRPLLKTSQPDEPLSTTGNLGPRFFDAAWSQIPKDFKSLQAPLFVALAYYLGAQAAFAIGTLSDRIFAPFWPPNVVLFCALMVAPKRQWWLYIAATFPAHVLAEISVGMPPVQLLVAFATNCIVATLNAYGVQRFVKGPPWFGTLRDASTYILITAGIAPAVSAFAGAFVQILGEGHVGNYWAHWGYWYISNALGSVTLGPAFLSWFGRHEGFLRGTARMVEAGVLGLGLGIVCAIVFHSGRGTVESGFLPALLYLPLPFILWAAIRFGQRGASGAVLTVTVVSIWQNLHESSVFIGETPEGNVLALQFFLIGVAVPVFFLGAVIDEVNRTGGTMRELAGALLRVQDEERRRIARELHDSTGQNLTAASLLVSRLQGMAPQSNATVVSELAEILRQSMVEIRTVSYLLHPPLLDGIGLDIALRTYLRGFSQRTGIDVDLDLPEETRRMPASVELVLFRVIQEALTNVWRHSGSATARIRLVQQPSSAGDHVTLSIKDFGKGIPGDIRLSTLSGAKSQQNPSTGLGLVGMRERLHQVGGSLEIESASGGTTIRAIIRLHQADVPASANG